MPDAALVPRPARPGRDLGPQFTALDALRREIEPQAAVQDPLALADREEALASWLSRHGIVCEWMIAPPLAAAGVKVAWCERVALVLEGPALEPGLEWVASTLSAATLLSELKDSSRRISELVAAIKSYSQMDRASVQHINVTDGIESTLLMLGYKLRDGITVVRDYSADVPRIQAYPGELNQVWTNLIDAMAGAGTLRLSTRAEGNDVVIEVGDTGLVCRRRWLPARSRPFTRPRTWAKAPVWASTSHGASSWSATVARSPSTPDQAKRCCESASPSGRQCPGGKRPADPVGAEYTVRAGQELPDTLRANRRADHAPGRDQQLEITEPGLYQSKSRDGVVTCMFAGSAKRACCDQGRGTRARWCNSSPRGTHAG
jgi:hypothetical protein